MTASILTFKNNLPNLTVLQITSQDLEQIKTALRQKIKQAPMMFIGMQLIVDVSIFDPEMQLTLPIDELLAFLLNEGINPVAVMSDRAAFRQHAVDAGFGCLPIITSPSASYDPQIPAEKKSVTEKKTLSNKVQRLSCEQMAEIQTQTTSVEHHHPEQVTETSKISNEPRKTFTEEGASSTNQHANQDSYNSTPNSDSQVIQHPIRSGQRVYSQGDLTIIGFVSPGAEVIAEGNIHIYGALKGRAIAGAKGNEKASIFCRHLDAELVAIAGNYKQLEDNNSEYYGKAVQISLDAEKICFFEL